MKEWMIRCAAGLAAVVLLVLFFVLPMGEENREYGKIHDGRDKFTLEEGSTLTWKWIPEEDGITELAFELRGFKKAPDLVLEADVETAEGGKTASVRQTVSELGDGTWRIGASFIKGKEYRITVRAGGEGSVRLIGEEDGEGFHPYTQWTRTTLNRYGTLLYVAAGFLLFALFPVPARRNSPGRAWKLLAAGALLMLSVFWFFQTLGIPLAYSMNESIVLAWCLHYGAWIYLGIMGKLLFGSGIAFEKKAGIAAVLLGILFMFAMNPKAPPDEPLHYNQAYGVSNYLLFRPDKAEGDARDYDLDNWEEHINSAEGYTQVVRRLFEKRSADDSKVYWVPGTTSYPLMYLPQGIGIALGRLLRANTLVTFFLGRLMNLLFYAFCVYMAVKAVPRKKELFFGAGMVPMAIHQAASYSYDTFTNGMAILWIALVLRAIWEDRPLKRKDYISLVLVGGLMAPSKIVYIILAGLLVLVPKKRFANGKKALSIGGITLAMLGITLFFWLQSVLNESAFKKSGSDVYTIGAILQEPFHVLRMLFYSVEENMPEWTAEAVGYVFSGYNLWVPIYIPILYMILLAVMTQRKESEPALGSRVDGRVTLLAIIGIGIVALEVVELLFWTPVGSTRVIGIQGRYFIPLIPPVLLAMETKSIRRKDAADDRKLAMALVFLHVLTLDHILIQTLRGV